MARPNPRRRLDQLAAEAERAIQERRDAVLPTDYDLDRAASISTRDISHAVDFYREANRGTDVEGLLDGPAGETERDT